MGSYLYDLDNLWAVQSSVLLRMTEATAPQLDLNIRGIFEWHILAGLGIQTRGRICGQFGNELSRIHTFAYNYDISTATNLLGAHSHELSVGYYIPTRSGFRSRPSGGGRARGNGGIPK